MKCHFMRCTCLPTSDIAVSIALKESNFMHTGYGYQRFYPEMENLFTHLLLSPSFFYHLCPCKIGCQLMDEITSNMTT